VGKQWVHYDSTAATQVVERTVAIHCAPKGNGGSDEREPARAILLCLGRTVAQPAEAMKADGASKGVARLTLVQLHGCLAAEPR
jgi:hypothetical protein